MNTGMKENRNKEKKKILYILNIAKRVNNFSYASMLAAQELGIEFHIAGNWSYASQEERLADEQQYGIKIHQIDFIRTPYHPGNRKAYSQLKELIQREKYDVIHCNTPIGGVLGRILGKKCKVEKVIYQAHGFHFYKGSPKINWMIYYPIEKLLARYTDALITINQEDFEFSKIKFKLRNNGKIYYVPGVGIDTTQYNTGEISRFAKLSELSSSNDKASLTLSDGCPLWAKKRMELNIPLDAFVIISVGELNANKNNTVIISALEKLNRSDVHYVLCGVGELESALCQQVKESGLENNVHFLGYRNDVKELYEMANGFVMPSLREGLSRSIMEAMASGLPCIVSKIRGNTDLVIDNKGGFLCEPTDIGGFASAIGLLCDNFEKCKEMSIFNKEKIVEFDVEVVKKAIGSIYTDG